MKSTFETLSDALDAGFTSVNRRTDKDVSGPNYFGYDYERDGERTVTVWLNQGKNKAGRLGCFVAMYPPKEG